MKHPLSKCMGSCQKFDKKTNAKNCQMLCRQDNLDKSRK